MPIFCWKQLKCFHVGQCLGQEKHSIFMEDTGAFLLIVLIEKWKEKRIFVSHYASDFSQNSFFFEYAFLFFFFIIPFEHSLVKFPTVYSFFFLQHNEMSLWQHDKNSFS